MATVYILDDDSSLLLVLQILLSTHNYRVATFTNSKDLYHAISLVIPDLIILDVRLSEKEDGKLVCTKLKQEHKYTNKVYLFSASPVVQAEIQKCGADGYIEKPFGINLFMDTIKQALAE